MARSKLIATVIMCFIAYSATAIFAKAPDIRIRVAQYENNTLEFVMPEGGTWQLGKADSGEIVAGKIYKITGKLLTKSQIKYHLMVTTVDLMDNEALHDKTEELQRQGFTTHTICVGEAPKAIGMPDNRVIHIGIAAFSEKEIAEEEKNRLSSKGLATWIYEENITNSSGIINMSGNGLSMTGSIGGTDGYTLRSKNGTILKKVEFAKGYSWHGFEDRTYKGVLNINFGFDNCIDCVETTDLEDLLIGIVPSEISAKAEKAAMQAQAVAARGEILSKKGLRHVNSGYEYCSEQHCQVYKGYLKNHQTISEKISETAGKILMMKDKNKILDAVYSSNCGGHSSANQNIWSGGANPHLQGVTDEKIHKNRDLTDEKQVRDYIINPPDSWCGTSGYEGANKYRWTSKIAGKDWEKVEEKANVGHIKNLKTISRDVSGRIFVMEIFGEKGSKILRRELEIRQHLGGLKSSCFVITDVKKDKNGYITSLEVAGAGFGHGVGMCQTGAQAMAGAKRTYDHILRHYFPEARLISLYK